MADAVVTLLFLAVVCVVLIAVFLWPELRRLQRLKRENHKLQREHDRLVRENRGLGEQILEQWKPARAKRMRLRPGSALASGKDDPSFVNFRPWRMYK